MSKEVVKANGWDYKLNLTKLELETLVESLMANYIRIERGKNEYKLDFTDFKQQQAIKNILSQLTGEIKIG